MIAHASAISAVVTPVFLKIIDAGKEQRYLLRNFREQRAMEFA
jgi:hypothetical protein